VQRWRFEHRHDEDEDWGTIVATFGPRASWIGPRDPAALMASTVDAGWQRVGWSTSRGIHKDPLHRGVLGPSGHVPEEFLHFGSVAAGEAIRLRTTLIVEGAVPLAGWLVVGAAASKRVWIDDVEVVIDPDENGRYQSCAAVHLQPGPHTLDMLLTAEQEVVLRASFAFTTNVERFRRPERITVAGDPVPETTMRFATSISMDTDAESAVIQVGVNAPARILVDDVEVGRQGGFLPYGDYASTHPYDITKLLTAGIHTLAIEVDDIGRPAALLVDGVVRTDDGAVDQWIMTDTSWSVTRDGEQVSLAIERRPKGDPALANWKQRPHPLPGARWLEGPGADDGSVVPIVCATKSAPAIEWLRCVVPPGAVSVELPLVGSATAMLDGDPVGQTRDATGKSWRLDLPYPDKPARELTLRVETVSGCTGGAILAGPALFSCREGRMAVGDWQDSGLADYSGMVRYRQTVTVPPSSEAGRVVLDLGDVRGTVEVVINGQPVGTRVLAPYRVDITEAVRQGDEVMVVEILVANTLAPYLDAVSPTPFVLEGQIVSGLFGPVRLLTVPTT
jgi:hypothetical protein